MERREFLKLTPSVLLAGCISNRRSGGSTRSPAPDTATVPEPTLPPTTPAGEPTVKSTPTDTAGRAQTIVQFGHWGTTDRYGFAVLDAFDAITTLEDTFNGRTVEMPAGKQLTTTDVKVKNITQGEIYAPGQFTHVLALIRDQQIYEHTGSFSHPEYDGPFDLDWIAKADSYQRYPGAGTGSQLASGETRRYWVAFVTPRGIDLSSVQVGISTMRMDGYEFRWADT